MTYELATKPDPKAEYRAIAELAKKGAADGLQVAVKLWDVASALANSEPTQEAALKLVAKLRAGMASINDGRYSVDLIGNVAWVSVNEKPVRTRKAKATDGNATPPAAKKASKK